MQKYVVCVACHPGDEKKVIEAAEQLPNVRALCSTWVHEVRKKGVYSERTDPLLPGYVFIFLDEISQIVSLGRLEKVHRVLRYGDGSAELYGQDLEFAKWVYERGGTIGLSRAMMVGDEVVIIDGPMKDYEGVIKKINRHQRYAQIEITLDQKVLPVWLGFQWMTYKDGTLVRWAKNSD